MAKRLSFYCARPGLQQGAIVLVSVVLMLVMVTLVTLYTGRIQSFEHKIMLNGQNHKFALVAANSGLMQGFAQLQQHKAWLQPTISGLLPNQQSFSVSATERQIVRAPRQFSLFELTSTGSSADGLSRISVSEQAIVYPLLARVPLAPLMVNGGVDKRGTFELVANPNGGGQGVALSVWTDGGVDMSQLHSLSCGLYEYSAQQCHARAYSGLGKAGTDILANDLAFPADVFAHLFNLPLAQYTTLRDEADMLISDCNALTHMASGIIWVSGDCDLPANVQLGNPQSPVILIVEEGNLSVASGSNITGLVFILQTPASVMSHDVVMASASLLTGALVANQILGRSAGTFRVVYAQGVLHTITNKPDFFRVAKVPGSWQDL